MRFGIRNFRSVRDSGNLEIRPITLLVGENSVGKSSFMAGLRFGVEFVNGASGAGLNKPPFEMGSFDDIAHQCGDEHSTSFEIRVSLPTQSIGPNSTSQNSITNYEVEFCKHKSLPRVRRLRFYANDNEVELTFDQSKETGTVTIIGPSYSDTVEHKVLFSLESMSHGLGINLIPFMLTSIESTVTDENTEAKSLLSEESQKIVRRFFHQFSQNGIVHAAAPVRTEPRRSYNLRTQNDYMPDGAHAIYSLARMKRTEPKKWRNFKTVFDKFGKLSGSYNTLDLRLYGKKESDPFRINLRTAHVTSNLADVGYGISQVIPILYDVVNQEHDILCLQQPEVHLHPRAQAALGQLFCELKPNDETKLVIETHSDYLLDSVRICVRDGIISGDDVVLYFFEMKEGETLIHKIEIDENGNINDAPSSYSEFFLSHNSLVLGAKNAKRVL